MRGKQWPGFFITSNYLKERKKQTGTKEKRYGQGVEEEKWDSSTGSDNKSAL